MPRPAALCIGCASLLPLPCTAHCQARAHACTADPWRPACAPPPLSYKQFGDKLDSPDVQAGLDCLAACTGRPPLLVHFTCAAETSMQRMAARGAARDEQKWAAGQLLPGLQAGWLAQHAAQVAAWNAGAVRRGHRAVVEVSTEQGVDACVQELVGLLLVAQQQCDGP